MSDIMSCPHCNGEMSVGPELYGQEVTCPHCQGRLMIPLPAAAPSALPSYSRPVYQHVPSYLAQAILVTLLCCLPFGIVAIVYAADANSKKAAGNFVAARRAADSAKNWCLVSLLCGVIPIGLVVMRGFF